MEVVILKEQNRKMRVKRICLGGLPVAVRERMK